MNSSTESSGVAVFRGGAEYPATAPFHAPPGIPEYAFAEISDEPNPAYQAVRQCLHLAGLDAARWGTRDWNPLGGLIRPGETVLLKPNLVKSTHPRDPQGWQYVLTHGSVIRAAADYVWKAIGKEGKVIIADAPQTDSSFAEIVRVLGLDCIRDFYASKGLPLQLIDLRREEWRNQDGVIVERWPLRGDPSGDVAFDLGQYSAFADHGGAGRYYGADYDSAEVNRHHRDGRHEYLLSGSAIRSDVIINLPKLKTHKKAGVTLSLKNLVGINTDKNWLPHHTEGDPAEGGDEHPAPGRAHRLERRLVKASHRMTLWMPRLGPHLLRRARKAGTHVFGDSEEVIRSGNWSGNDTVWRMCLDLNTLLAYGNADGSLRQPLPANRKRHFVLVDGIIAGEGAGPINPDPVACGVVAFGTDAPSVDAVCTYLMGFDPEKVPIVRHAFRPRAYPLTSGGWQTVQVSSNVKQWNVQLATIPLSSTFCFRPHFGWREHLEHGSAAGASAGR